MTKRDMNFQQDLEQGLENIFPQPDPAFLNRLEGELVYLANRQSVQRSSKPAIVDLFQNITVFYRAHRRAVLAIGLALLLGVVVLAAGPEKVLAGVLRIFGYAPGVGFVEPGITRILPEPVSMSKDNVTVLVEQMIASEDNTLLSLSVSGLPREKFLDSDEIRPYLILPDGRRWDIDAMITGMGEALQAEIDFPALPADVLQVTLVMPRLPSLPAGFAPENWSIPLVLQSTVVTPGAAENAAILVQPYIPVGAVGSVNGVSASVLQVADSSLETGLEVKFTWQNPAWESLEGLHMRLSDDREREYERLIQGLGEFTGSELESTPNSRTVFMRFSAFHPDARRANLTFDELIFSASSSAAFTFDPGLDPQPGQEWNLAGLPGMSLEVSGIPVEILRARLLQSGDPANELGTCTQNQTSSQPKYCLEFLMQVAAQDSLSIRNFSRLVLEPAGLRSYMTESLPDDQVRLSFVLSELPSQAMTVRIEQVNLLLTEPLVISWSLPAE